MLCLLISALLISPAQSLAQEPIEPTVHWAYASYFGTGWYKINDERSAFVLRMSPRWSSGEAKLHEDGSPDIAYTFRVPVTLGVNQLDFEDLPVNIWYLKFDRLGLAYNYRTTGELRGIKFVFRSLYELWQQSGFAR